MLKTHTTWQGIKMKALMTIKRTDFQSLDCNPVFNRMMDSAVMFADCELCETSDYIFNEYDKKGYPVSAFGIAGKAKIKSFIKSLIRALEHERNIRVDIVDVDVMNFDLKHRAQIRAEIEAEKKRIAAMYDADIQFLSRNYLQM